MTSGSTLMRKSLQAISISDSLWYDNTCDPSIGKQLSNVKTLRMNGFFSPMKMNNKMEYWTEFHGKSIPRWVTMLAIWRTESLPGCGNSSPRGWASISKLKILRGAILDHFPSAGRGSRSSCLHKWKWTVLDIAEPEKDTYLTLNSIWQWDTFSVTRV